jgi:hypothetical protein
MLKILLGIFAVSVTIAISLDQIQELSFHTNSTSNMLAVEDLFV